MSDSTARDGRLDQLSQSAQDWADKQTKYLQNQVVLCKAILKGRTGQERLAQASVQAASALVVTSINDFLAT